MKFQSLESSDGEGSEAGLPSFEEVHGSETGRADVVRAGEMDVAVDNAEDVSTQDAACLRPGQTRAMQQVIHTSRL